MTGPLCSDADAWRAASEIRGATGSEQRLAYITDTLTGLGVELGEFDRRIVRWLAKWEPETDAVILSWCARAFETGQGAEQARLRDALTGIDTLGYRALHGSLDPVEALARIRSIATEML